MEIKCGRPLFKRQPHTLGARANIRISEMFLSKLIFFVGFTSTFSSEIVPSCSNNFITTMNCELNSLKAMNCFAYTIEFSDTENGTSGDYKCPFMNNSVGLCTCTVQMPQFITYEKYKVKLLEGNEIIYSYDITPSDHIKPNAPEIHSVTWQENGNYNVTWIPNYHDTAYIFKSLRYQISYKKKGEDDKVATCFNISQTNFEILSNKLEEGSSYVVRVRSYSEEYGTEFSNWSQEVDWTNPLSLETTLKIVIPILCVFLIITLCALYWCTLRMKDKWWDKIPDPYIAHIIMTVGKPAVLNPQEGEETNSKCHIIEKPRKAPLITGENDEESLYPKTHLNPEECSQSDYARTYSISQEKNITGTIMQNIFEEAFKNLIFNPNAPPPVISDLEGHGDYKNVDGTPTKDSSISSSENGRLLSPSSSEGSGSSRESQYRNISYSWVSSLRGTVNQKLVMNEKPSDSSQSQISCSSIDDYHSHVSEELKLPPANPDFPLFTAFLSPLLLTDSEYQACDSSGVNSPQDNDTPSTCSSKLESDVEMLTPPPNMCSGGDGYQSFNDAISNSKRDAADPSTDLISKTFPDMEQITEDMLICSINPAYAGLPANCSTLAPSDESYHPLQSLSSDSSNQQKGIHSAEEVPNGHKQGVQSEHLSLTTAPHPIKGIQNMTLEGQHFCTMDTLLVLEIDNSYHRV